MDNALFKKLANQPHICTILLAALLGSCLDVDKTSFAGFGGTLWSAPREMIIKDLHFRTKEILGQSIVIQGKVSKLSSHGTFAILGDESAKVLVSLVYIRDDVSCCLGVDQEFKVLGSLELSPNGQIFLEAKSFHRLQ